VIKAMDVNAVTTAISTLGFPIVMCGAMFWYMLKEKDSHKEEMNSVTEALNNNTLILQKLCDKLGGDKNDSV
jgi:hypothetical protein